MVVICLFLVIFAPSEKAFLNKEIYPPLDILSDAMQLHLIKDDLQRLNDQDFVDYPDPQMWKFNADSNYQIFPFYMFGTFAKKNIAACPDTFRLAHYIPYIRTMSFMKLGPKSVLKVHQSWKDLSNDTFRCILGLDIPVNDIHACGIWVQGNVKKIEDDKWVVFDASKKHSMFNKQDKACYMLMFDLKRPTNVVGLSEQAMPPDMISEFIHRYDNLER